MITLEKDHRRNDVSLGNEKPEKGFCKEVIDCFGGSQKRDAEALEKYGNLPENFFGGCWWQ